MGYVEPGERGRVRGFQKNLNGMIFLPLFGASLWQGMIWLLLTWVKENFVFLG